MNLNLFAHILQDADAGEIGKSIFVHFMPATVRTGLLVKAPVEGSAFNAELPGYVCGKFQVISRAPTYADAEILIKKAVDALHTQQIRAFDPPEHGFRQINLIVPTHYPWTYPRSDSSDIESSVNFDCSAVIE